MNTKITFHLITFLMFVDKLYSLSNTQIYWTNLVETIRTQFEKNLHFNQSIYFLTKTVIKIDSNSAMSEYSSRTINASNRMTAFEMNFITYNHFIF